MSFFANCNKHGVKMYAKRDKWNIDEILSRCVEIFAQMQYREGCRNKARAIYPDPQYMIHANEERTRRQMFAYGQSFHIFEQASPLTLACYMGDCKQFMQIVSDSEQRGKLLNFNEIWFGESEWTLLFAIMAGYRWLFVNPVTSVSRQVQAMKRSLNMQHFRVAQYLLDHGLDVNIQNKYGYTTLHECVINCPTIEFAAFLLKRGANPNLYNIFCSTPLHECGMRTNVECTKLLCDNGANPLLYDFQGYRVVDVSSARNNIEIYTILQNRVRKMKEEKARLEYEDADYCFVCNISRKHTKLYRCDKCASPERYCSLKCQKLDWKRRHKHVCHYNRNKVPRSSAEFRGENELVFKVKYCTDYLMPTWMLQTGVSEYISRNIYGNEPGYADKSIVVERNHQQYRDRRQRKFVQSVRGKTNEITAVYPKCGIKQKFVIKIQVFPNDQRANFMLCYEKAREYKVRLFAKNQSRAYKKLFRFIRDSEYSIEINEAKKAYFYAYVDKHRKLHIFLNEMVAAQPW